MKRLSAVLLIISLLFTPFMFSSCSSDEVSEDFYFTISWGVNGDSGYNSKTGELIRSRDYSTTLTLSDEDMKKVYDLITELDPDSHKSKYVGMETKPPFTLQLVVGGKDYTKTITLYGDISKNDGEKIRLFDEICSKIIDIITSTEEWESLPYHLYI